MTRSIWTCVDSPKEVLSAIRNAEPCKRNNSLAEAHTALGFVLLYWDWATSERELLKAIALTPRYVVATIGTQST